MHLVPSVSGISRIEPKLQRRSKLYACQLVQKFAGSMINELNDSAFSSCHKLLSSAEACHGTASYFELITSG